MGQPVDGGDIPEDVEFIQFTHPAPLFEELTTETEIFETGIKAIDLLEPYVRGGKTGLFGGAGVGKTVLIQELITTWLSSMVVLPYSPALESVLVRVPTSSSR